MDTTMLIPMLERLGWTSLQTVLLVALVYGLCRALPSLSAATRCRLWWLVSLQAVLGLFWSQPLQLAWLPAPQAVAMTATDVAADIVYPLAPEASAQLLAAMPLPAAEVPAVAWWAVALSALWLSGVLVMALRTFGEWRRCRALLAAAYPCEDEALVQALQLASDAHGVRGAPRLWMSTQVEAPQLVGPFRPVLLLPAGDNVLQGDALDLALTHELQHLQRRDLQWGLLPALAQHLFFFHPLLRLSVREYAQAREEAVDAAVVGQHGASRQAYGRLLLQLGVAPQPHLGVASAAPSTTSLKRRLLSLQSHRSCPRLLAVALTAVVVVVGVAPMRLVAAPVPPAPPAPPAAPKAVVPPPPKAPEAPPAPASAARVPAEPVAPAPPAEPADMEEPSGPDDADAAYVDDAAGMDEDHDGTTTTSSITTYGRLDLGKSPREAFVLVDGDSTFANGGMDDVMVARRQLGKGPALWFRQGDKRYVVRDPMLIQSLQRAYAGAADLGRQQSELGRQQSALGRQQGDLGKQMGEMGRLQGEEARRLALAAAEAARSAMAAHDINREAAAEAAKAARGATNDAAVAREAAREAAAEARRAMQEVDNETARAAVSHQFLDRGFVGGPAGEGVQRLRFAFVRGIGHGRWRGIVGGAAAGMTAGGQGQDGEQDQGIEAHRRAPGVDGGGSVAAATVRPRQGLLPDQRQRLALALLLVHQSLQQQGQRHHILMVVVGHPAQVHRVAAAQEAQPCAGRFRAGQVVLAHYAQQLALDGGQPAVLPGAAIAATGGVEQVHMVQRGDRIALARQPVARLQQRRIVAAAVVAAEHGGGLQPTGEGGQHRFFRSHGGHQQLADAQAFATLRAHVPVGRADHEGTRAGATGQAGGLGIKEQQVARSYVLVLALGEGQ
mgnify:CR=1 FL=1